MSDKLTASENYEIQISALVDGEVERDQLLELVDRIADDPEIRHFYRQSRALAGLIEATEPTPRVEPPPAVWTRISSTVGLPQGHLGWGGRSNTWRPLLLAAAVVVIAASVGWWTLQRGPSPSAPLAQSLISEVSIGEGEMSENRFVVLATEILQADRKYRREMVRLISSVEESLRSPESSSEGRSGGDFGELEDSISRRALDVNEGGAGGNDLNVRLW